MWFSLEIPVPSLTLVTPWLDVFPSERVQMSCGMNGSPDWTYTWYKDGQQVHAYDGVTFFGSSATTLSISSASAAHRGRYSCSGKHTQRAVSTDVSPELTLSVYGEFYFSFFVFPHYLDFFVKSSFNFIFAQRTTTNFLYLAKSTNPCQPNPNLSFCPWLFLSFRFFANKTNRIYGIIFYV